MIKKFIKDNASQINRTAIASILIITLGTGLLAQTACVSTAKSSAKLPLATNMASKKSAKEVTSRLKKAGLSNTGTFKKWTLDFAKTAGKGAGLTSKWKSPKKLKYNTAKMADHWEKKYDYSDADCRMTAFLLMKNSIKARTTEKKYNGSYLMFDVDAIKTVKKYKDLKDDLRLFTTLFGEKKAGNAKAAKKSLAKAWKNHGIKVKSSKAKLLSVVIYDKYEKVTFVGHTGILIDLGKEYLFVEKIAFEQPYQATRVKNLKQLKKMLGSRPEYFGGDDEPGPYIYLNGKYKGELKKTA